MFYKVQVAFYDKSQSDGEYSKFTFINLHENENTSYVAAKALVFLMGGKYYYNSP